VDLTSNGSGRLRYLAPADRFTLADPSGRLFALNGFDELVTATDIDLDQDQVITAADLSIVLGAWGTAGGDVTGDGTTNGEDLGALLGGFGSDCRD
jgi:hypothetical protein